MQHVFNISKNQAKLHKRHSTPHKSRDYSQNKTLSITVLRDIITTEASKKYKTGDNYEHNIL